MLYFDNLLHLTFAKEVHVLSNDQNHFPKKITEKRFNRPQPFAAYQKYFYQSLELLPGQKPVDRGYDFLSSFISTKNFCIPLLEIYSKLIIQSQWNHRHSYELRGYHNNQR